MAFNVSYNFIANDAFTRVSRKINNAVNASKRKFKALGSQFEKTGRKFSKTSQKMKRDTGSIASSLKGLFVGGALFLGFRKLINVGGEFQESLLDLSAITGATGADLDILKEKTFELAKATSTSQAEILTAFKLVGSAKPELLKNIPALQQTTKEVLLLKNAAGIGLADAAMITAQSLNIFGQDADQANKFVNILAAGAKFGASEIGDTGRAVLLAGPAARAAGIDFLELNAAIQATALGGIKGAQAGTALNAILGRLRRAGLDIAAVGLPAALEQVKLVLESTTNATQRAQLEAQIFGEEHAKVGLSLINNIDALRALQVDLKGTSVAEEQATLRLSSFNAKMRRLGAIINEVLIKAFLALEPTILQITDKIGLFFEGLTQEDIDRFVALISAGMRIAVAVIERVLGSVSELFSKLELNMDSFDSTRINSMVDALTRLIETIDILSAPGRFSASVLKGVGIAIGETAAMVRTFDFRQGTAFTEAFSIGGRFLGVGNAPPGAGGLPSISPPITPIAPSSVQTNNARADINVNVNAPKGAVKSMETSVSGSPQAMNLGANLVTQ